MSRDPRKTIRSTAGADDRKRLSPLLDAAYRFDARHGGRLLRGLGKGVFSIFEWLYALAYIPTIRNRIPALDPNLSEVSWIPINQDIPGGGGVALPQEVMDRLIEASNYRVIIDFCACRKVYGCKQYPQEVGCLFMGRSAKRISKSMCREATVADAKAHVRRAIAAGLVPLVGEARADHDLLRIPFEGTLLTSCFCCECCCLSRFLSRGPLGIVDGIMKPVEGFSIAVTDACIGCGVCETKCFIKAIKVFGGRAVINEYCRICGRCVAACPQNAIHLKLDNPHAANDVVARILSRVDLS